MAYDFKLLVLFTSSPGFHVDVKIAEMMKDSNSKLEVVFGGPPVTMEPDKVLDSTKAIDFIVRREFDYQIANYAKGTPLEDLPGVSYRRNGANIHNPGSPLWHRKIWTNLPWVTKTYKRGSRLPQVQRSVSLNPRTCRFTLRAAVRRSATSVCGRIRIRLRWLRLRSVQDIANECRFVLENFPGLKEIFFDDDTFNYRIGQDHRAVRGIEEAEVHLVVHPRVSPPITKR